jgi:hypothetical protein
MLQIAGISTLLDFWARGSHGCSRGNESGVAGCAATSVFGRDFAGGAHREQQRYYIDLDEYDRLVGRPKDKDYPPYMSFDAERGGFVVRNPLTGKKKRFPPTKEADARIVATAVAKLVEKERLAALLDAGKPTIAGIIEAWKRDRLAFMPWDDAILH